MKKEKEIPDKTKKAKQTIDTTDQIIVCILVQ